MTCSPQYAYGRDTTAEYITYLKHFKPDVEIISQAWPKLFQPDYTEVVTKILQTKPQALYSCLWGGDITSFIDQGNIYALFTQIETFAVNMADYTALTAVKNLPKGIHSGNRYIKTLPKTAAMPRGRTRIGPNTKSIRQIGHGRTQPQCDKSSAPQPRSLIRRTARSLPRH